MDQALLVDTKIEDGRNLLARLVADGLALVAAFWARKPETGRYRFYMVTPAESKRGGDGVFGTAIALMTRLPRSSLSPVDITMIRANEPLARVVLELQRVRPNRIAEWIQPRMLEGGEVEEVYIYPLPKPRPGDGHPIGTAKVRLKTDVERVFRDEEFLEPLTPREAGVLGQLVSTGVAPAQAEYLIRKRRESDRRRSPIPAGTVVDSWVTGWWGDRPEDDPNPLLEVRAPDGTAGLTFKDDTEPV